MPFIGKIEVLTPGLFTTIQDAGRFGYRKFGVPQSGVMDEYSAALANLLVGNDVASPLLEISYFGPKLKFGASAKIAVCGADISLQKNGKTIALNRLIKVNAGDVISFGRLNAGARSYLAVSGGFIGDYDLDSCSTYLPARFGGIRGRQLQKGDLLFFNKNKKEVLVINLPDELIPRYKDAALLKIIKGPEFDVLTGDMKDDLEERHFELGKDSNRMGIRLKGKLRGDYTAPAMLSSALAKGNIQLLPNKELVVAMSDCQTTGGYPRVASVVSMDLSKLAQIKPGGQIKFKIIDLKEAKSLFLQQRKDLERVKKLFSGES